MCGNNMVFNPKVSIVIPVYNGANFLTEAIDSALSQSYSNIEIIVINDGSDDSNETDKLARSYGNTIQYYHKKNGGVASALNLGIRKMRGDYFSWLSHDDVYDNKKIETQIDYLKKRGSKEIITFSNFKQIDGKSRVINEIRINNKYIGNIFLTILSLTIHGCTLLVPRKCFETIGGFSEDLMTVQDNHMWLKMAKAGYRFEYIPDFLVKCRIHAQQTSNRLREFLNDERDYFFLWAIRYINNEVKLIQDNLYLILIKNNAYQAYIELLKLKYHKNLLSVYKVLIRSVITFLIRLIVFIRNK
jgi:glycosyltransferase involved in cell wall biosynthesis